MRCSRCGESEGRWLWSCECGCWWLRWLKQLPDITPSKVHSHQTRMKGYAQINYMLSQCKDAKDNPAALFANCVWSERTLRGLEYRPGPPRIFPPVHIHPSAPGARAGRHIAMSPECHNDIPNDLIDCCLFQNLFQNLRGRRYVRFGASCGQRGERFQEWDMECGMDYVPCREMDLHWPTSV